MKSLSVAAAERLCKEVDALGVIVFAFDENNVAAASYGTNKRRCGDMARLLENIWARIAKGHWVVWGKPKGGRRPHEIHKAGLQQFAAWVERTPGIELVRPRSAGVPLQAKGRAQSEIGQPDSVESAESPQRRDLKRG